MIPRSMNLSVTFSPKRNWVMNVKWNLFSNVKAMTSESRWKNFNQCSDDWKWSFSFRSPMSKWVHLKEEKIICFFSASFSTLFVLSKLTSDWYVCFFCEIFFRFFSMTSKKMWNGDFMLKRLFYQLNSEWIRISKQKHGSWFSFD